MDVFNVVQPTGLDALRPAQNKNSTNLAGASAAAETATPKQDAVVVKQPTDANVAAGALNKGDTKKLDSLMTNINGQLQSLQSYLQFERDEDTNKMVFFIKNVETDEVIRQIPSEEFLAISKNISKYLEMAQQSNTKTPAPAGLITNEIA